MRHYLQTLLFTLLVGAIFSNEINHISAQNSYDGPDIIVKSNQQIIINPSSGINLDLSRLSLGQATFVEMRDAVGTPYTFRVKKTADNKFAVAANPTELNDLQPNTTIRFVGKDGLVKAVNLTQLAQQQRCGVWCVLLHICCVHIHIGPPANTWEWSCTNCQPGQN